jgi:uncharacterized membrane protein YfcA
LGTITKGLTMIEAVLVFVSMFVVDIFYAIYLKSIENNKAIHASSMATIVFFIASIATIGYVDNHWLLLPACLGAFAGTWVGVKYNIKKGKSK